MSRTDWIFLILLFLTPFFARCALASASAETAPWSVTLAPGSVTFHPFANDIGKSEFQNHIGSGTTLHPGLSLTLRSPEGWTTSGMYFRDSFGNPAGALMFGRDWGFSMIGEIDLRLGLQTGLYVRENAPESMDKGLLEVRVGGVELMPLGGVSVGLDIPLNKELSLEPRCFSNVVLNNCSIGVKIGF